MNGVKLALGSGVVAVLMAGQLAHMTARGSQSAPGLAAAMPPGQRGITPHLVEASSSIPSPVGWTGSGGGEETIGQNAMGQFETAVEIAGDRLPVLIDTGASSVVLRFEDAERLRLPLFPADFKYVVETANGRAYVARIVFPSIRLGRIEVHDVTGFVSARGALAQSLLGMSFLSKIGGWRVDSGRLVLRQ